jgi:hypothetical protein
MINKLEITPIVLHPESQLPDADEIVKWPQKN